MKTDREFALASASLRQALQDMPEITEMSKNIMFEETKAGLNLEIVDQDGRSMFAEGSKVPLGADAAIDPDACGAAARHSAAASRLLVIPRPASAIASGYDGFDLSVRSRQCRAPDP